MRDTERRAAEARRLLDEPLLNEALELLEQQAVNEILRVPFWADRRRRMLTDRVRVIRGIRDHLRTVIMAGDDGSRKRPTVA